MSPPHFIIASSSHDEEVEVRSSAFHCSISHGQVALTRKS
jgi:hypothetical protein